MSSSPHHPPRAAAGEAHSSPHLLPHHHHHHQQQQHQDTSRPSVRSIAPYPASTTLPPLGTSSITGSTSGSASPSTRYGSFPPGTGATPSHSHEEAKDLLQDILARKLSNIGAAGGGIMSNSRKSRGKRRRWETSQERLLKPGERVESIHVEDADLTTSEEEEEDGINSSLHPHPSSRSCGSSKVRRESSLRRSADDQDDSTDDDQGTRELEDEDEDLIWTAGEDPNSTTPRKRYKSKQREENEPIKQWGILKMELMGRTWGKRGLCTIYAGVYLISTLTSLEGNTTPTVEPYFLSVLGSHSMLSSVVIIMSIAFAVGQAPMTKVLDVFGRAEGVALAALIYSLGYCMTAGATSPVMYIVARAFSALGGQGLTLAQQIIVADTTTLSNRGLITSTVSLPWILTTWIGPPLGQFYLSFGERGYRAAYATFGLLLPCVSAVLFCTLMLEWRRIKKAAALEGRIPSTLSLGVGIKTRNDKMREVEEGRSSRRSRRLSRGVLDQVNRDKKCRPQLNAWGKAGEVWKQLDVVGLASLTVGCTVLLLPLTLAAQRTSQWHDPEVWFLIIVGVATLTFFCIYEIRYSEMPLLPPRLLKNRTILAGSALGFFHFTSQFFYESFFTSFLQVARGHSAKDASYIAQSYIFSACVSAIIAGWLAKVFNRYKFVGVIGVLLHAAGVWLMSRARDLNSSTFELTMSQIIGGAGGGFTTIAAQIGCQSVVNHQDVGMATAIFLTITQIGGAVGGAGAGAVWSTLLPSRLKRNLPEPTDEMIKKIMGSLPFAMSFPIGSLERAAIDTSYVEVQKVLNTLAMVMLIPAFLAVCAMRNVNLEKEDKGQGGEGVVVLGRASFLISTDDVNVDSETSSLLGGASDATRSEP